MSQKLEVKFREIMCKAQVGQWTIRFWFTERNPLTRLTADTIVSEFVNAENLSGTQTPESVSATILKYFEDAPLAAFEVLDTNGNGIVTYTDW